MNNNNPLNIIPAPVPASVPTEDWDGFEDAMEDAKVQAHDHQDPLPRSVIDLIDRWASSEGWD